MTTTSHSPKIDFPLTRRESIALAIIGCVLLWLIFTRTFATYAAKVDLAMATYLQPREPRALLLQGEAELTRHLGAANTAEPAAAAETPDVIDGEGAVDDGLGNIARLAKLALARGFEIKAEDSADEDRVAARPVLTQSQLDSVRALALQSLQSRPINSDAMSLLARLADAQGKGEQTAQLMQTTLRLSVRESYAAYWLLEKALADGDIDASLTYADILLRTRATSMPYVVPKLAGLAESAEHRSRLAGLLATRPPWRGVFFARLMGAVKDARTPLFQFLELKKTSAPPTSEELATYLNFLAGRKFHDLAYYTWLQFQPQDALAQIRPVKNGGFEVPPDGGPFDWTIASKPGVRARIVAHPSKPAQNILSIEFRASRAVEPSTRQTLLLPPGAYRLSGQFASSLLGPRGLIWRVRCLSGATLVATEVLRGSAPGWAPFSASFSVPASDCRVQTLALALDEQQGSERFLSGTIRFDDLAIERAAPARESASPVPAR